MDLREIQGLTEGMRGEVRKAVVGQDAVIDLMLFGVPAKAPYKRWKRTLPQILSWERFNPDNYMTVEQIDEWVRETRHKVMYRDENKVD